MRSDRQLPLLPSLLSKVGLIERDTHQNQLNIIDAFKFKTETNTNNSLFNFPLGDIFITAW